MIDDEQLLKEQAEDEQINAAFQAMLDTYLASRHRKKVDIITRAFTFAKQAHKGVRRHSGEPYIMHPIAVARIVSEEIGLGSTSICAALLHDVVEDTDYTVEDIRNLFGDKIAQIVDNNCCSLYVSPFFLRGSARSTIFSTTTTFVFS